MEKIISTATKLLTINNVIVYIHSLHSSLNKTAMWLFIPWKEQQSNAECGSMPHGIGRPGNPRESSLS